jgi:hypothetical protein
MKKTVKKAPRKLDAELQRTLDTYPIRWSEPTVVCAEAWTPWEILSVREWVVFLDRIEDALLKVRRQTPPCRWAVA